MLGPWPHHTTIFCVNHVDVTRKIFVWSCGTHSLKAVRTNIYRSQPKFLRNLKVDSIHFGWKDMDRIFIRGEARINSDSRVRTNVNKNSVNIDQYTMINAEYAKSIFTNRTITEVLGHLSIEREIRLEKRMCIKMALV